MTRIILLALLLAGCASAPRVISSSPDTVLVKRAASSDEAAELAIQECASYGKQARLAVSDGRLMSFDCVLP